MLYVCFHCTVYLHVLEIMMLSCIRFVTFTSVYNKINQKLRFFLLCMHVCFNQISIKLCSLTSIVDLFFPEVSTADNCFIRPPLLPTVYILCMYNIKLTCLCQNSCKFSKGNWGRGFLMILLTMGDSKVCFKNSTSQI